MYKINFSHNKQTSKQLTSSLANFTTFVFKSLVYFNKSQHNQAVYCEHYVGLTYLLK